MKRVAVIGPNADNVYNQLGDYTAPQAPGSVITVLEGIRQKLPGAEVCYVKGCAVRDTLDTSIGEACETAKIPMLLWWFWGGLAHGILKRISWRQGLPLRMNARRVTWSQERGLTGLVCR